MNLLSIKQLTKATGVDQSKLHRVIKLMNVPTYSLGKRKRCLDTYSQDLLFMHLSNLRMINFITLPSKMNIKEPEPEPIYSDRNNFIKLGYLE
jgi:hypothetical protein